MCLIYLRQYGSPRHILFSKSTCGKVTSWILEKKWWKIICHLCVELFFSMILQCSPGKHDVHHVHTWFDLWTSSSTWEKNFPGLRCGMFLTMLKIKYAPAWQTNNCSIVGSTNCFLARSRGVLNTQDPHIIWGWWLESGLVWGLILQFFWIFYCSWSHWYNKYMYSMTTWVKKLHNIKPLQFAWIRIVMASDGRRNPIDRITQPVRKLSATGSTSMYSIVV